MSSNPLNGATFVLAAHEIVQLPCHVLLTKADKISRSQAQKALDAMRKHFRDTNVPGTAQVFSSSAKTGVDEARARVMELLATPRPHEL